MYLGAIPMSDLVADVIGSALDRPDALSPPDHMADHELALELLAGYRGGAAVTFPTAGSDRDRLLRAAPHNSESFTRQTAIEFTSLAKPNCVAR
jgi:hypothetical protein